ncbi:LuxR family transcriptional regulator [Actibacterium sp. 188UL27-1]|uniref:LuxR family transcriptional regulator n=1 Tax=Actibacterium sp. 188UL27-1 TaxID=2786961 RepID=UPI00195B99C6|nr:LuxR family transcriptional regulator [Actibacterium sp. 188UL27-1]MBM7067848.1 LuxR family transcriptional regulator [Actibacterium sp. 188UL27-1]
MIEYTEKVMAARDMESLWQYHLERMSRFGFGKLLYGFTFHRTETSLGDPQDWLILTNHGKGYIDHFLKDGLYFHAPMVRWAVENTGHCSWAWIEDQSRQGLLTPSEQRVYDFNRDQGVTAGYTISFNDVSARTKGGVALTAADGVSQAELDEIWAVHGRKIVAMNNIAHLKIINLPYSGERRPLTKRQREALEWVGEGKTTQDIATIMGLTAATVEKHLRLAREAMDVDTTAQAVLKASFQNQIFVLER